MSEPRTIFTIGYGGLKTLDDLKAILDKNGITKLIDIRSVPHSRKWKKDDITWSKEDMQAYFGARYIHKPTMGGKGFEPQDYLRWQQVAREVLMEVMVLAETEIVALMCTEKNWKKCHRNYLAGRALQETGRFKVEHL